MNDERIRCWSCGYNLTGNASGRCPECGRATHRDRIPGLKSIYCPACDCDLTRSATSTCPDCGRLFDHDEMLRRANWCADDAVCQAPVESGPATAPLVKLGPIDVPGRALWPDDLTDSPVRLRPLARIWWPLSLFGSTTASAQLARPTPPESEIA